MHIIDILMKAGLWIRFVYADPDTDTNPAFFIIADPVPDPGF
jgi:hypothetical protein